MKQAIEPDADAPRWPALLALTALVSGLHLLLLLGAVLPPNLGASVLAATPPPLAALHTRTLAHAPGAAPSDRPAAALGHSVARWVDPPAARSPAPPTPGLAPLQPAPTAATRPVAAAAADAAPSEAALDAPSEAAAAAPSEAPLPAPADESAAAAAASGDADAPTSEQVATAALAPVESAPTTASPAAAVEAQAQATLPPSLPPPSARLLYQIKGSVRGIDYRASGTLDWRLSADRYSALMELRIPLLGSRVQTSTGLVDDSGLLPERFADRSRSERAAHFDHAQRRIRFSANTPDAVLLSGAQDRLSVLLQIAGLFNAQPQAYQAGQRIRLQVAGHSEAEIWYFEVGTEETLHLPAGQLLARQLLRHSRHSYDSRVEIWLAPSLLHLPVRLRITQHNGDLVDQQLSELPGP